MRRFSLPRGSSCHGRVGRFNGPIAALCILRLEFFAVDNSLDTAIPSSVYAIAVRHFFRVAAAAAACWPFWLEALGFTTHRRRSLVARCVASSSSEASASSESLQTQRLALMHVKGVEADPLGRTGIAYLVR
ncbi:hypothetical protein JG688_00003162 [Phytophthora aleatoria]|uniref:Uncharacterized protein n=1 Tax=Phytophthora aleatoria TaxID=2496075 RepID=A0A8J5J4U8_9STRA|nr:hypothetical protein JG688_00003162 [Phytophthora aleatoria]